MVKPVIEVVQRKLRSGERCIHAPKANVGEECYLGRLVYVVNPYERCSLGCCYCYAEWPWSPPRIVAHVNIDVKAMRDLKRLRGKRIIVNVGSATDPYQHVEEDLQVTRRLLKVLADAATFFIATRSTLVARDIDILKNGDCWITFSIPSINDEYYKIFEPYTPKFDDRLKVISKLLNEGILVVVRVSPIIPMITDNLQEVDHLLYELSRVGVKHVVADVLKLDRRGYIMNGWEGMPSWKKTLSQALTEWSNVKSLNLKNFNELYENGELLYGYIAPPLNYRAKILSEVRRLADKYKLLYSTCRMGPNLKRELCSWIEQDTIKCACIAKKPKPIMRPKRGGRGGGSSSPNQSSATSSSSQTYYYHKQL
ncbi:MAG: SPL family radical SAM protein [Candidatus Nezhaarchaeales archaeon]